MTREIVEVAAEDINKLITKLKVLKEKEREKNANSNRDHCKRRSSKGGIQR